MRQRRPTAAEDRKTNARLRGDLYEKDQKIAGLEDENATQADTIASLTGRVDGLVNRIESLEGFRSRDDGFAPSKLIAANFSTNLITNAMLSVGIDGTKLEKGTVFGSRLVGNTVMREQIDLADLVIFLDGRYTRK